MLDQSKSSHKWPIALFTIGVFMAGLDNGIISVALTTINEAFGVSTAWGAWSITLYTLGIAISVPIIGKLSDNFGRRRLFIIEIALFGIGSLLVSLSPNFIFLLCARFIQAIGGGGIFIIGSSHILATLPKDKQGKALGLLGGMHGLSAVIGPNLGAVILSLTGSWHWMFLINIPIAIFLAVLGYIKIPETKPGISKPLDVIGTMLLSLGILALMYGITRLDSTAFIKSMADPNVSVFLLVGIGALIGLIFYERQLEKRGGDPIISYSLLKTRVFQMTLFLGLLSGGFLAGIIFIPAYVEQVLGVPVEHAGYWLTPLALASGIGAGLGGFLTDKYGAIKTVTFSGVIGVIGFLLFPFWVTEFLTFMIASILSGIGLGIMLGAPLNVLVGMSAEDGKQGAALGTLSLIRQMGLTLFPTIYAGLITGSFTRIGSDLQKEYGNKISDVYAVGSGLSEDDYGEVIEEVRLIADPELQNDVLETVSTIIKSGYDQMFITSSIMALFVCLVGIYLRSITKKM